MLNFGWAFFYYLLDELRCSYIRLRRVILLCSCIRLVPSGIRFASFGGEYNITVRIICKANLRTISLRAKQVISLRSNITIYNHDLHIIKTKRVGKLACQQASADCSASVLRTAKQSALHHHVGGEARKEYNQKGRFNYMLSRLFWCNFGTTLHMLKRYLQTAPLVI